MDKIKVIFLDIDGVLNDYHTTATTSTGYAFVDAEKVRRLKKIINETDAKVVLSSDWRYDRDTAGRNTEFIELRDKLAEYHIEFYGFTPDINWRDRGSEIQAWLDAHPEVSNFVILDDRGDMEPNLSHLVRTNMNHGLTDDRMRAAIDTLGGK